MTLDFIRYTVRFINYQHIFVKDSNQFYLLVQKKFEITLCPRLLTF